MTAKIFIEMSVAAFKLDTGENTEALVSDASFKVFVSIHVLFFRIIVSLYGYMVNCFSSNSVDHTNEELVNIVWVLWIEQASELLLQTTDIYRFSIHN